MTSPATKSNLTLQDLLIVEDDAAIPNFRCAATGLPIWPHVRIMFLRLLMSDLLYGTSFTTTTRALSRRMPATMARSIVRNASFRLTRRCRAEVCLFSVGVANQWIDGKWLNRLTDHFALSGPERTLTIEESFEWRWQFPRHNERVMFHAPFQAYAAVAGRVLVRERHRRQAEQLITLVSERSKRYLNWRPGPQREQHLIEVLSRKIAVAARQYRAYQSLLAQVQPKLLMIGAACYGPAATLICAARNMNITTAEYQHGAISAGHDAYNFAPAVRDSQAYRETLPDHFLSYGSWWNEQINAPVSKTVIGNPHREARLQPGSGTRAKEHILILSDGIEFGLYLDLARRLEPIAKARGLKVVIRPHPYERSTVQARYGQQVEGVSIDQNVDIYESLRCAHAVISEVSTGLFDAVDLADRLFIFDTPKARFGYPTYPFPSFTAAQELAEMLLADEVGRMSRQAVEAIWAPQWHSHYAQFLRAQGVGTTGRST